MEQIFGADLTYEKVSEEKFEKFLEELCARGLPVYLEDYEYMKKSCSLPVKPKVYLDEFSNIGEYGVHAFMKAVIDKLEDIDITCDSGNGHIYVGMKPMASWEFKENTLKLTEREYADILQGYLDKVFDNEVPIYWHSWKE